MNSKLKPQNSTLLAYAGLVRWAFTRFYREFAWTYDAVASAVSGGRWAEWGLACLPYARGRVLELGCGTGNLQAALAHRPHPEATIAIDLSPQMLAIARHKLARKGLPARLVRADAGTLPFPPSSFDTILASFPSDYILEAATLAEIGRVLRPGGRLAVVLAASFTSDGLYQRAVGLLYRLTLQRSPAAPPKPEPQSLLGRRLREHGFAAHERWELAGESQVHMVLAERV